MLTIVLQKLFFEQSIYRTNFQAPLECVLAPSDAKSCSNLHRKVETYFEDEQVDSFTSSQVAKCKRSTSFQAKSLKQFALSVIISYL